MSNEIDIKVNVDGKKAQAVLKALGGDAAKFGVTIASVGAQAASAWSAFQGVIGSAAAGLAQAAAAAQAEAGAIWENIAAKQEKIAIDAEESASAVGLAQLKADAEMSVVDAKAVANEAQRALIEEQYLYEQEAYLLQQETLAALKEEQAALEEELRLEQLALEDEQKAEALAKQMEFLAAQEALNLGSQLNRFAMEQETTDFIAMQEELRNQINVEANAREVAERKKKNDLLVALETDKLNKLKALEALFIAQTTEMAIKDDADTKKRGEVALTELLARKAMELNWEVKTEQDKDAARQLGFQGFQMLAKEHGEASKAAAIAQATIQTYNAATAAYSSLAGIPIAGPGLGAAAAAAAIAAGFENIRQIRAQKFALGGVVSGHALAGDSTSVLVNAGELILNKAQQDTVAKHLQAGSDVSLSDILVEIRDAIRTQQVIVTDDSVFESVQRSLKAGRSLE